MEDFIQTQGWFWKDYAVLSSTNDKAQQLSETGAGKCYVVSAAKQTAGRGRRGRDWSCLEGNLFMSLLLPFKLADCGILTFMVSLALLQTVKSFDGNAEAALKWPNDVLLRGKKISGILLEKGADDYMVAGIGVNLKKAPELPNMVYSAGCLADAGITVERKEFLQRYLCALNALLRQWRSEGNSAIVRQWSAAAIGVGTEIAVNLPRERKTGVFAGVDDNGMLILQTASGCEIIGAGDVFFVKEGK